ncbi:protein FAR1-RELATED SEQUENCE 5-like [Salvia divinorum]|uniref:Protein FAR1-RELATED SEQUENCE 5-like n=1 Tax=Salvia divinorum TaxID=28513 RepID=A0ABD1HRV1_SALDI
MFALFSEELRKAFESKIETESEDSYTYAIDCLLKMENGIDGMIGKANTVTVETNNVTIEAKKAIDIEADDEANESQIKGLKPKGRESEETTLINDDYWNLTYSAFDPQSTS